MIGRVNTGGGVLNFKVVGGTVQPENPKENTIWIKTGTAIFLWHFRSETIPPWPATEGTVIITSSTVPVNAYINVIKNTTKDNAIYLQLLSCTQYIDGAWRKREAYVYKGGTWVQFSSEFAATINVTYPAGSTCTATDGTTTLTAPDTSGAWACVVPNTGTWTVTCTNGSSTATASVSITTNGDSQSVTLAYALPYFYDAGKFNVKWQGNGSNSGGVLTVTGGSASSGTFEGYFVIPDIHNYKTISCYISSYTNVKPTVSIRKISDGTTVASAKPSSAGSTVSIDVSSLSGNDYYFVLSTNSTWENEWVISNVQTTKIWGDAR